MPFTCGSCGVQLGTARARQHVQGIRLEVEMKVDPGSHAGDCPLGEALMLGALGRGRELDRGYFASAIVPVPPPP